MTLAHRLAAKIVSAHQMKVATAMQIVDLVLNELAEAVADGDTIDIPGVGTLHAETVPERRDYNPSTGAPETTPSSVRVTFRPANAG